MPSHPTTSADNETKEVYAHFGLAIYLAQCLEHGLVNALVVADLLPAEKGRALGRKAFNRAEFEDRYDVFLDDRFGEVIGELVRRLQRKASVPVPLMQQLTEAKDRRNYLAHRFFRLRAEDFLSRAGRQEMLSELAEAQSIFEKADDCLIAAAAQWMPTAGLQSSKLQSISEKEMANAYSRASARDDSNKRR